MSSNGNVLMLPTSHVLRYGPEVEQESDICRSLDDLYQTLLRERIRGISTQEDQTRLYFALRFRRLRLERAFNNVPRFGGAQANSRILSAVREGLAFFSSLTPLESPAPCSDGALVDRLDLLLADIALLHNTLAS